MASTVERQEDCMTPESAPRREHFDDIREFIAAHESFHDAHPPTTSAILERAVRLGSDSLWGITVQVRRIRGIEPEDSEWWARVWLDLQFLIVVLWRMRQSGVLALSAGLDTEDLNGALASFDADLPDLKRMRDVAQHFDEYAVDGNGRRHTRPGRAEKVGRRMLEVGAWDSNQFRWLDGSINFRIAERAARNLYAVTVAVRNRARAQADGKS
jgi:hypothetical protein